jgi:hypothetical protein
MMTPTAATIDARQTQREIAHMRNWLRGTLIVTGMAIALGLARIASADPVLDDFTVDPSSTGSSAAAFVADKITGNYHEILFVTGPGTFATYAYFDAGQFVHDDGTIPWDAGDTRLGVDYNIYALFVSDGTFAPNGLGGFTFTGGTGRVELYLDKRTPTTGKTLPSAPYDGTTDISDISRTGTGDDTLLATADLLNGQGHTASGLANGDFGLLFSPFSLTATGADFFVAPDPFYMSVILKGQFNSFDPTKTTAQTINGSLDAFFAPSPVPEPATLTLLGLGLAGTAVVVRRRQKNA